VIVGTPGRVMDHMRRGTLKLDSLKALVLDEADEMLRMGFIDDIKWVLQHAPENRQMALFSATLPPPIKRIAQNYLKEPIEVSIQVRTGAAETIRQRYWLVSGLHKLDALTRILEAEDFDAMLIFVRTKTETLDLAEKLLARGYSVNALNGDIPQKQREKTVEQLKKGKIDLLVATDVAARGLDVERISHVLNYDIPVDTESYIHRIGRTGRAGRSGDAILFVSPRERHVLRAIEHATRKPLELMELPSTEDINNRRVAQFKQRITDALAVGEDLSFYQQLIGSYEREHDIPALEVAAALARLLQGDQPLLLKEDRAPKLAAAPSGKKWTTTESRAPSEKPRRERQTARDMQRYRLDVGRQHGVQVRNLVGAIANEAGLDSQYIGQIDIHEDFSLVDLPTGMPKQIFKALSKAWVAGRQLKLELVQAPATSSPPSHPRDTHKLREKTQAAESTEHPKHKPRPARKKPSETPNLSKGKRRKAP
jgi:ATP-dependent RNA helicase DeaD